MKIIALDIGDQWTGIALSDALCILARPYKTVPHALIEKALTELFTTQQINTVVVGLPKTLRNTISEQTQKTMAEKERLEKLFTQAAWVTWDERLTSQQAQKIKSGSSQEAKLQRHAIAAALILQSYLDFKSLQKQSLEPSHY